MFGAAAACRDKHRLQPGEPKPRPAEARRIYKSPFLTGLAPPASARELLGQSTASDKVLETGADTFVKTGNRLRLAQFYELQNRRTTETSNRTTVRKQLFFINPPAPLRRQRTAESTNHADKSRNPCHSGCEVAFSKVKMKG